jgi:hypothetical protein
MPDVRQAGAVKSKLKLLFKLSLIVGFMMLFNYGGSRLIDHINFQLWPEH